MTECSSTLGSTISSGAITCRSEEMWLHSALPVPFLARYFYSPYPSHICPLCRRPVYLGYPEPVICLLHGLSGILHRLVGVPGFPVRAETLRNGART